MDLWLLFRGLFDLDDFMLFGLSLLMVLFVLFPV